MVLVQYFNASCARRQHVLKFPVTYVCTGAMGAPLPLR